MKERKEWGKGRGYYLLSTIPMTARFRLHYVPFFLPSLLSLSTPLSLTRSVSAIAVIGVRQAFSSRSLFFAFSPSIDREETEKRNGRLGSRCCGV